MPSPPRRRIDRLSILERVRAEPPYELLVGEPFGASIRPGRRVFRRIEAAAADPAAELALERATENARRAEHPTILACHGLLEHEGRPIQALDAEDQVSLDRVLPAAGGRVAEVPLAVWIGRQILDAITHAGSIHIGHGRLEARHVWATPGGAILVDYGACRPDARDPEEDVRAAALILWELLTGVPSSASRMLPTLRDAPAPLVELLDRRVTSPGEAGAFRDALTRIFYVELDGDDRRDGADALARLVASRAPASATTRDSLPPPGIFRDAEEARRRPVVPVDLGPDDAPTGTESALDPLAPGREAPLASEARTRQGAEDEVTNPMRPRPLGGAAELPSEIPLPRRSVPVGAVVALAVAFVLGFLSCLVIMILARS